MAPFFIRGVLALLLTIAGSIWMGLFLGRAASGPNGAAPQHKTEVAQLNTLERQLQQARGPLKKRIRALRSKDDQPFRLCPAHRGRVIRRLESSQDEIVRFPERGIFLRRSLTSSVGIPSKAKRRRALCVPLKRHNKRRFLISIIFGGVGIIGGLAWLLLPLMRRLRQTEAVVRRLAEGDYHARVNDPVQDAVGSLAAGVDQIGNRIHELLAAQRHLHASVSHELRTPLARLAAAIDLAEDHPNPKLFKGMRTDIRELDGMVEELLTLARLQDPQARQSFASMDLVALVQQRVEMAQRGEREPIEWSLELPHEAKVAGDARLLARLLDNLLANATRHTQSKVNVSLKRLRSSWCLNVSDNGSGIAPEQADLIFTPFMSGADGGSAGLGLAICREIADRHDAQLTVKNGKSGGADFQLILPG